MHSGHYMLEEEKEEILDALRNFLIVLMKEKGIRYFGVEAYTTTSSSASDPLNQLIGFGLKVEQ